MAPKYRYPKLQRSDTCELLHGCLVPDPYRRLEGNREESAEVADWLREQNRAALEYLTSRDNYRRFYRRIEELSDSERRFSLQQHGDRLYFLYSAGKHQQSVLCCSIAGEKPVTLPMPEKPAGETKFSFSEMVLSPNGKHLLYGMRWEGSDWEIWRVINTQNSACDPAYIIVPYIGRPVWAPDSRGYYYVSFSDLSGCAAGTGKSIDLPPIDISGQAAKVFYHRLGRPTSTDTVVYQRPDQPGWRYAVRIPGDGRILIITIQRDASQARRVTCIDPTTPQAPPIDLVKEFENHFDFLAGRGAQCYFLTDQNALNRKIIAIDINAPQPENWRGIVSETEYPLASVKAASGHFLAKYIVAGTNELRIFSFDGTPKGQVPLPTRGSVRLESAGLDDHCIYYTFSSYLYPPTIFRCKVENGAAEAVFKTNIDFNFADYTVTRGICRSDDGTPIPIFIFHRKKLALDGAHPVLLNVYGGFAKPMAPAYSYKSLAWVADGGIWAMAHVRGGGEGGAAWHQEGVKEGKLRSVADLIRAAEWLITEGYTNPSRLALTGKSNGALLAAAAVTQRPELFQAVIIDRGPLDLLRFHHFPGGKAWLDEYGNPDDPEDFKSLYAYSPYHKVGIHSKYPATLIITADNDSRVCPSHSFKFAAALQHCQCDDRPILLRIQTGSGHGQAFTGKRLREELAEKWAFIAEHLQYGPEKQQ